MVVSGVVRIDMYLQRQYHDIPVAWGKYIFVISNGTYRQAMYQLMCIKITSNILLYASLLRMNWFQLKPLVVGYSHPYLELT